MTERQPPVYILIVHIFYGFTADYGFATSATAYQRLAFLFDLPALKAGSGYPLDLFAKQHTGLISSRAVLGFRETFERRAKAVALVV
jgi:hypothetical protein